MSVLQPATAPAAASPWAGVVSDIHVRPTPPSGRGKQLTPTEEAHLIRVSKQHIGQASATGIPKRFWIKISDSFLAETGRSYSWQSCRRRMTDLEIKQQKQSVSLHGNVQNSPPRDPCSRQTSLGTAGSTADSTADSAAVGASDAHKSTPTPLSRVLTPNINESRPQPRRLDRTYPKFPPSVCNALSQTSSSPKSRLRHITTNRPSPHARPRSRSRSPCTGTRRPYRCRSPVTGNPNPVVINKVQKTYNPTDSHDSDSDSDSDDGISLPETPVKPIRRPLSKTPASQHTDETTYGSEFGLDMRLSDQFNLDACDKMSEMIQKRTGDEMWDFCNTICHQPGEEDVLYDACVELRQNVERATAIFRERIGGRRF